MTLGGASVVTEDVLAELLRHVEESASAYMRGDMRRCLDLVRPAEDCTLMAPTGGEPTRGQDESDEAIEAASAFFRNGDATLDVFQTFVAGDLVVLVLIERQHGEVGGLPDQDWSLRVTMVCQRRAGQWQIVHRHADPLVRGIGLERAAALARG
jgi:ketosteroid isomerase-like protein